MHIFAIVDTHARFNRGRERAGRSWSITGWPRVRAYIMMAPSTHIGGDPTPDSHDRDVRKQHPGRRGAREAANAI